ncbi:MAG: hypothetical protein L6Q98_12240 [Anaerolineae bacterium]|nr:hypothetical protein [Anaerolineae bacterium]NUQ07115.1 hypothetical protein [Anaerolineae bacterium]
MIRLIRRAPWLVLALIALTACGCRPQTPPPIHPIYPATPTPAITPVPLQLTPVTTPIPLPALPPLTGAQSSKPLALAGDALVVVNPDSDSLTVIDAAALRTQIEIPLGGSPRTLALDADERRAVVTLWDENALAVVDLGAGESSRIEGVCHLPYGVVIDSRRAYVSCLGSDQIAVIDLETGEVRARVGVGDAPVGLALSGSWLLAAHLYTGAVTVLNVERTPFALGALTVETDGELARTIIVSPDGQRAYIPQTRTGLALISLQYMQDWFPVVSVLDLAGMTGDRDARLTLSSLDANANMPADAAFSPDGAALYVALAGSDAVLALDPSSGHLLARVPVGAHPTGVIWGGDQRLFVLNALDGTVSVIDARRNAVTATITATNIPLDPTLLRGKILFHRAAAPQMSDGAISCATCHFEGGADGRSWINFRSGPRNTPALGGAAALPPYHWAGDMTELHDSIEDQIRHVMLGDGLIAGAFDATTAAVDAGRSDDLDALAAYVASLRPWASPYRLPDGDLSDAARRGMELFMSGSPGCGCHAPPLYTDLQAHDLAGAAFSLETTAAFDTPTLRGLWATAPYMHDGVVASLEELLSRTDPIHSVAGDLTDQQLDDLIAFLLSL